MAATAARTGRKIVEDDDYDDCWMLRGWQAGKVSQHEPNGQAQDATNFLVLLDDLHISLWCTFTAASCATASHTTSRLPLSKPAKICRTRHDASPIQLARRWEPNSSGRQVMGRANVSYMVGTSRLDSWFRHGCKSDLPRPSLHDD